MKPSEVMDNYTLKNRISATEFASAMGLDYEFICNTSNKTIPIIILYPKVSGLYLKVPTSYKKKPEEYLSLLKDFNYHFLLCEKKDNDYLFALVHLEQVIKFWKYSMATSKGNTNRLQFYGQASKIQCSPLMQAGLISDSVYENLIDKLL
jgi:hypothetical protein